jgi:archaellum biogenesis ATPase FlaH
MRTGSDFEQRGGFAVRFENPKLEDLEKLIMSANGTKQLVSVATMPESRFERIEDWPRPEDVGAGQITWVVEGLVPAGNLWLLTGDPGSGKSTVASAMAYAVAMGLDFAGRHTTKRPVVILDRENPVDTVLDRFQRLGITTSADFRVLGQWAGEDPPAPDSSKLVEWVARCEPKPIIVIDSFIRFHPGDENSSTDTREYMNRFRVLAAAGATPILLHHTGKSEKSQDYRGSSDIKAAIDIGYKLTQIGTAESSLSLVALNAFKQRVQVESHLKLRYKDGQFLSAEQDFEAVKTVTASLIDLLKSNPGITTRDFHDRASKAGLGRNRADHFLKSSVENGNVQRVSEGQKHRHYWVGVTGVENRVA